MFLDLSHGEVKCKATPARARQWDVEPFRLPTKSLETSEDILSITGVLASSSLDATSEVSSISPILHSALRSRVIVDASEVYPSSSGRSGASKSVISSSDGFSERPSPEV
ncbi:hypothetical protein ACLKA7_008107 [Drosophila subpalustris]